MDEDHPERDIQVLASIGYYKLKEFAMPFNKDSLIANNKKDSVKSN